MQLKIFNIPLKAIRTLAAYVRKLFNNEASEELLYKKRREKEREEKLNKMVQEMQKDLRRNRRDRHEPRR